MTSSTILISSSNPNAHCDFTSKTDVKERTARRPPKTKIHGEVNLLATRDSTIKSGQYSTRANGDNELFASKNDSNDSFVSNTTTAQIGLNYKVGTEIRDEKLCVVDTLNDGIKVDGSTKTLANLKETESIVTPDGNDHEPCKDEKSENNKQHQPTNDMKMNKLVLKEKDVLKLILEFFNKRCLYQSQMACEQECMISNRPVESYSDDVEFLRKLVLNGRWNDVMEFIQPLTAITRFEYKKFRFVIYKSRVMDVLNVDDGIRENRAFELKERIEALEQLHPEECSSFIKQSLSSRTFHTTRDVNRFKCFMEVLPLVEPFLDRKDCLTKSDLKNEDLSVNTREEIACNDRLVQLLIKGVLYESCVNFCQERAVECTTKRERVESSNTDSSRDGDKLNHGLPDKVFDFNQLLTKSDLSESDVSLLSWLQSIPDRIFSCPFEQKALDVDLQKLKKVDSETTESGGSTSEMRDGRMEEVRNLLREALTLKNSANNNNVKKQWNRRSVGELICPTDSDGTACRRRSSGFFVEGEEQNNPCFKVNRNSDNINFTDDRNCMNQTHDRSTQKLVMLGDNDKSNLNNPVSYHDMMQSSINELFKNCNNSLAASNTALQQDDLLNTQPSGIPNSYDQYASTNFGNHVVRLRRADRKINESTSSGIADDRNTVNDRLGLDRRGEGDPTDNIKFHYDSGCEVTNRMISTSSDERVAVSNKHRNAPHFYANEDTGRFSKANETVGHRNSYRMADDGIMHNNNYSNEYIPGNASRHSMHLNNRQFIPIVEQGGDKTLDFPINQMHQVSAVKKMGSTSVLHSKDGDREDLYRTRASAFIPNISGFQHCGFNPNKDAKNAQTNQRENITCDNENPQSPSMNSRRVNDTTHSQQTGGVLSYHSTSHINNLGTTENLYGQQRQTNQPFCNQSSNTNRRSLSLLKKPSGGVRHEQFTPISMLWDVQAIRSVEFHPKGRVYAVGSNSKVLRIVQYPFSADNEFNMNHGLWSNKNYGSSAVSTNPNSVNEYSSTTSGSSSTFVNFVAREAIVISKRIKHHRGSIYCISWNNSGELIATGSNDKTVRIIKYSEDNNDIQNVQELEVHGHDGTIRDCMFLGNLDTQPSTNLVSGGAGDCNIRLTDCQTGQVVNTYSGHCGHITTFSKLHNSPTNCFISGSQDGSIRFWDSRSSTAQHVITPYSMNSNNTAKGQITRTKSLNDDPSSSVSVSSSTIDPTCRLLVTGHVDGTCCLYDIRGHRLVQAFSPHTDEIRSCEFSPQGAYYLLTGSYDTTVALSDMQGDLTNKLSTIVVARHQEKVTCSQWHPEQLRFVSTSADKSCVLHAIPL